MIVANGQGVTLPWRHGSVIRIAAAYVAGLALIGLSWYGVSGTGSLSEQEGWLDLAVVGLVVAVVASCLWLLEGRRAIGLRHEVICLVAAPPEPVSGGLPSAASLVTAPGMRYYHRSDCLLAAGKPVRAVDSSEVARTRLWPCGICRP